MDPKGRTTFVDYKSIYGDFTYNTPGFSISPRKTALLIIDVQAGMLFPDANNAVKAYSRILPLDFSYFVERVRTVTIPNIQRLLRFFRETELRVVHTWVASETEDFSDFRPRKQRLLLEVQDLSGMDIYKAWQPEMKIIPEVAPVGHELVMLKKGASAFNNTPLDETLRNMGIDTLVLVGGNTNGCLFQTAVYAAELGYSNILVDDAAHAFHPDLHNQVIEMFPVMYGLVRTTDEIIAEIRAASQGRAAQ